jgi:GDPmannose 4,6-dehydratase
MNALIFGASGQDGVYISGLCGSKNIEVTGVSRSVGNWIRGDVKEFELVNRLIKDLKPSYIFHLAANSTTKHNAVFENHATISTGTLNILEAAWTHSRMSKVFITGSGLQFRNTGEGISEDFEFDASSPYSVSRIQSVYAARYYRRLGLNVYVGYLFHHESPFRKERHVSQVIAKAARGISEGRDEIIELGDLSVRKEWAFAGDIAKGIMTLVQQDNVFEACIGTGVAYSIEDWVRECFKYSGKDWHRFIKIKESFVSEYPSLFSNPATINEMGWRPEISFTDLAKMFMTS